MNRHTFYKEIEALRKAVEVVRDAETGLSDAQNNEKDPILACAYERDMTILNLAAELVEGILPPK